jgi:ABC-type uncharacterized transport system YnjBCD ATPase subunit
VLNIENLHAEIDGKPILRGIWLDVRPGEIHAIMGPNGAGKSTLANVLSGKPGYTVTAGTARLKGQDLLALEAHERAALGLFLGFQYPVEIAGVSNLQFLRTALNAQRRAGGIGEMSGANFIRHAKSQADRLGFDMEMLKRPVNVGFSGGEKNLFDGSAAVPRGRLRVDVPVALARSVIVPKLAEFRSAYPDIEIVLGVSDKPTDLIADGIDCVIRIEELFAGSMIGRLIGRIDLVVCGSPDYLAARGIPRTIANLPDHDSAVYFSGRGRRAAEWHFIEDGAERSVRMRPALLVNDSKAFVACAIAALGLFRCRVSQSQTNSHAVPWLSCLQACRRSVGRSRSCTQVGSISLPRFAPSSIGVRR